MKPESPLLLTTCINCGVKHFVPNPRPTSTCTKPVQTFELAPASKADCEIIPFSCTKCRHPQFAEACYDE